MPRKLVPRRYVSATFPPAQAGEASARGTAAAAWERLLADPARRAVLDRPGELLSEYFRERHRSRLGKIVTAANAWPLWCETVVVVAPHEAVAVGEAIFAATAHPFYNHLSSGGRGGRPRLLFVEPTLDNDRLQGLLDLLKQSSEGDDPHDRWALVVVQPESSPTIAATASPFVSALRDSERPRHFVLSADPDVATFTSWQAPYFFDPTALLAASTVGTDVVQQLKGAVWFTEQAKSAPPLENEAIQLAESLASGPTEIVVWHDALKQLACGFALQSGSDITVINGCHLHERRRLLAPTHHRRLHLICDAVRRDRLGVIEPISPGETESTGDGTIERFVPAPQALVAAYDQVRAAEATVGVASAEIRLSRLNDPALGELCAWLSAVIEMTKENPSVI